MRYLLALLIAAPATAAQNVELLTVSATRDERRSRGFLTFAGEDAQQKAEALAADSQDAYSVHVWKA